MVYVSAQKLLECFILCEEDVFSPLNSTLFSVETTQQMQEVLPTSTERAYTVRLQDWDFGLYDWCGK